jgi:predicted DNA binding CopG/RHH family protein
MWKKTLVSKQPILRFATEDEEREFWATHDATDYIDFSKAQLTLMPNLRPTLKTVSLRLPGSLFESIKILAHKRDVSYQSLMKLLLAEGVERELYAQQEAHVA